MHLISIIFEPVVYLILFKVHVNTLNVYVLMPICTVFRFVFLNVSGFRNVLIRKNYLCGIHQPSVQRMVQLQG